MPHQRRSQSARGGSTSLDGRAGSGASGHLSRPRYFSENSWSGRCALDRTRRRSDSEPNRLPV